MVASVVEAELRDAYELDAYVVLAYCVFMYAVMRLARVAFEVLALVVEAKSVAICVLPPQSVKSKPARLMLVCWFKVPPSV